MEWKNEQIRFSSNSGVFWAGNNGNYQGGVLMKAILFISLIFICGVLTGSTINDILLYRKLQKGWIAVGNHLYKVSKIVFINMSETDDDENQS